MNNIITYLSENHSQDKRYMHVVHVFQFEDSLCLLHNYTKGNRTSSLTSMLFNSFMAPVSDSAISDGCKSIMKISIIQSTRSTG